MRLLRFNNIRKMYPPEAAAVSRLDLRFAYLERFESGIIALKFHPGMRMNLSDAQDLLRAIIEITGGEPARLLLLPSYDTAAAESARRYLSGRTAAQHIRASALVVSSLAMRLVAGITIGLNRPPFAFRTFPGRTQAEAWLSAH